MVTLPLMILLLVGFSSGSKLQVNSVFFSTERNIMRTNSKSTDENKPVQ